MMTNRDGPGSDYQFTLYVAGVTEAIDKMVEDLRREMIEAGGSNILVDIVNVLDSPEMAANADVFVTPTLIRTLPRPVCRLIGNIKDTARVILAMNMDRGEQTEPRVIV